MAKLIKVAMRREDDGTPEGQSAPCYFMCPCGAKIPCRDRQGQIINVDQDKCHRCDGCGQRYGVLGYLVE